MAKQLNKKMVVGLTIAGMAITTGALILMIGNLPKTDPEPLVRQAEQAAQKKEYEEAAKLYQNAARRARMGSNDPTAGGPYLVKAGEMALAAGNAGAAMELWQRVILNNPSDKEAQAKIVKFRLEYADLAGGGWQDVQRVAQSLVDLTAKKDGLGLHALGRALVEQRAVKEGNAEEGFNYLKAAFWGDPAVGFEGEPGNSKYADALGKYYVREAQLKAEARNEQDAAAQIAEAKKVYDKLVESSAADSAESAKAYLTRGGFYSILGELAQPDPRGGAIRDVLGSIVRRNYANAGELALADMEKAVSLAPKDVDVLVGMGAYWHNKKLQAVRRQAPSEEIADYRAKARGMYRRAIEADYDHYDAYLRLAQLYQEDDDHDSALKVLDERIGRGINRSHYLGWRNRQYMIAMRDKSFQVAMGKYFKLPSAEQSGAAGKALRGRLETTYKETLAELPGGEQEPLALMMKARLAIVDGTLQGSSAKYFEAIEALQKAEKAIVVPTPDIRRMLAELYIRTNAPGEAEAPLREVVAMHPNDSTSLGMLAIALASTKRPDEAGVMADRALAIDPTNAQALQAKAMIYQAQKNWEGLAQLQQRLSGGEGNRGKLARASLLVLQSAQDRNTANLAEAEKLLREVVTSEPGNLYAMNQLVMVIGRNGDRQEEVQKVLADAKKAVEDKKKEIAATQPASAQDFDRILASIEQLEIRADPKATPEQKIDRMESLIRRGSDPYAVAMGLFELYSQLPGRETDAMKAIQQAASLKPDEQVVYERMFQLAIANKDWKTADQAMQNAVRLNLDPSGGSFYRGRAMLARGDTESLNEAVREFRLGVSKVPTFAEGYSMLGQALLAVNQLDEAQRAFEEAVQRNPRIPMAVIGLAYIASSRVPDPLADPDYQRYFASAVELAPDNAWVKQQMQIALDRQDPAKGIARREAARDKEPKNKENLLALAELYRQEKRFEDARKTYQQALDLAPDDLRVVRFYVNFLLGKEPSEPQAARDLLKKVVQSIDSKDHVRKAAAQLLLAQEMLAEGRRGGEGAPTVQDVTAAYEAAASISDDPSVKREIGVMYADQLNRYTEAEAWFRKAIAGSSAPEHRDVNRQTRRLLLQTLLRQRDFRRGDEIKKEVDAYRAAFPEDPVGILFRAELEMVLGRDHEAMEDYNAFLNNKDADPLVGHFRRGLAHMRRNNWEAAISDFREVKRRDKEFSAYQGWAYLARALDNAGQMESAITEYQALLADPSLPERSSSQFAQELYELYKRLRRWDSAAGLIKSRRDAQPENPTWDFLLVDLASARGQPGLAINAAMEAVKKSNGDPYMMDVFLRTLLDARQYDTLIQYVGKLESHQKTSRVLLRLASAQAAKGNVDAATDAYVGAVEAPEVDLTSVSTLLAEDVQRKRIDAKAAGDLLRQRIEKQPQQRAPKLLLALVEKGSLSPEAYTARLKELLASATGTDARTTAERLYLMRELALHLYSAKQLEESRKYYEQVLAAAPNDIVSNNNLAYLLMDDLKDPKAAEQYSRRVAALMPENAGVLDSLGWNLVLLGQFDEGIAKLQLAVEKDPKLAAIQYHLAEGYYRRSSVPNARDKDSDLKLAGIACQTAFDLISKKGTDEEGVLDRVVALGTTLNLKLEPASIKKPQPTASTQ